VIQLTTLAGRPYHDHHNFIGVARERDRRKDYIRPGTNDVRSQWHVVPYR